MMQRKFRAWDENPDLPVDDISERMYSWENLDELDKQGLIQLVDILKGEENFITPMLGTGLLDKNGKERYEGDIIKRSTGYVFEEKISAYRMGDKNSAVCYGYNYHPDDEIIGNIYESPDLLTKK